MLAHSGGEDQFPPETPYGFDQSVRAGVDLLDLNVNLTADGVLIAFHDDSVDRTTNAAGDVGTLTYDQLHALDDAYWFTNECTCTGKPESAYVWRGVRTGDKPPPAGYTADDFAVIRLTDLMAKYASTPLNIEIKGSGAVSAAAARQLAVDLETANRLSSTVVSSFDDAALTLFHQLAPTVELSPGLAAASGWVLSRTPLPDGMRILQLPPALSGLTVITAKLIADSAARDYPIWVWPNNRELENLDSYEQFLAQGIAGLNINFPATGTEALRNFLQGNVSLHSCGGQAGKGGFHPLTVECRTVAHP